MVFLLGFFVKQIVARWWTTWEAVPLPGSFHWDHSFICTFYYWGHLGGRPFVSFCFFSTAINTTDHLDLDQPPDPLSLICHSIVEKTPKGKRWAARINRYLVVIMIKLFSVLDTVHNECLTDGKMFSNWFHFPFQILSFELCPLSAKNKSGRSQLKWIDKR